MRRIYRLGHMCTLYIEQSHFEQMFHFQVKIEDSGNMPSQVAQNLKTTIQTVSEL